MEYHGFFMDQCHSLFGLAENLSAPPYTEILLTTVSINIFKITECQLKNLSNV